MSNADTTEYTIARTPPGLGSPIYPPRHPEAPPPPTAPVSVQSAGGNPAERFASVQQLEALGTRFDSRLADLERTTAENVENVLFWRTQEYLAERYEGRLTGLSQAVEGLPTEVIELQNVCSRLEAARLHALDDDRKPLPAVGVGSAPSVRASTPIDLDSQAPQERVQRNNAERRLEDVVTELSSALRKVNERLDDKGREASKPAIQDPTSGAEHRIEAGPLLQ